MKKNLEIIKKLLPEQTTGSVKLPVEPVLFKDDPDLCKRWCRYVWWHRHYTLSEILDATGVPPLLIRRWINGKNQKDPDGWIAQRKKAADATVQELALDDKAKISSILNDMMEIINNFIREVNENGRNITMDELNSFIASYERLFKTRQLLMGQPTQIETKNLTWDSVREKMMKADIIYDPE